MGARRDQMTLEEITQRAVDALSGRNPSYSCEESIARAPVAAETIHSCKRSRP